MGDGTELGMCLCCTVETHRGYQGHLGETATIEYGADGMDGTAIMVTTTMTQSIKRQHRLSITRISPLPAPKSPVLTMHVPIPSIDTHGSSTVATGVDVRSINARTCSAFPSFHARDRRVDVSTVYRLLSSIPGMTQKPLVLARPSISL